MNVNPLFIIQEDLWFLFVCSFFSGSFTFQKYCWPSQSPRVFGIRKTFTLFIDLAFFFNSTNSKCLRS